MRRVRQISLPIPKGFTLLECLTAVAVLIIILSTTAPAFYQWFQRQQVVNQTRSIGQMLSIASKQAVQTGKPVYVVADPGKNWCIRLTYSVNCDCRSGAGCGALADNYRMMADNSGSYFFAARREGPVAKFSGTHGMSMGFATTLYLSEGVYQGKVILSNLGRVRHCMTPATGGIPSCS